MTPRRRRDHPMPHTPAETVADDARRLLRAKDQIKVRKLSIRARKALRRRLEREANAALTQAIGTLGETTQTDPEDWTPEVTDRATRASDVMTGRLTGLKGAYWPLIGRPPQCRAGDRAAAWAYHRRVVAALERGGWAHSERASLLALERVWARRARGDDPRFELVGNRRGRLPIDQEAKLRRLS